ASMARLARTLGILVSRGVVAADGDHDLDLWVRARPDGDAVALAIGGWTPRPQRAPWLVAQPEIGARKVETPGEWRFAPDTALRLTALAIDGIDAAPLIGAPLTRLVRLIEDEDGDLPVIEALAAGQSFAGQRAVRRDRHGEEVVLGGVALRDGEGRFIGYDRTATGTPADVLGEPEDTPVGTIVAERLDKALRAPLGRIVAQADAIGAQAEGPLRRDYADYAGDIAAAARHLLGLVDDLSDLQAIERPDFRVEREDIDLADVARRAAGLLQVRAVDRDVRIDRPGADETLPARGEFRRTLQILVNLIGNAVRYSPPGASVWIRSERDADSAVLIIADQGKGIAVDDQARIFDKFERVDPSEPGGSGLGLYIARRLARAMGGDVTVDSAPGQGARFVLTLPAG
ncbi:MAG: HAMP domain-containing histidine kinase, partial [Sphingomonadaceae bacterium]|nr:HAMP domain-containing histidine kinase [Sphingomonadaceae bacterium]